MEEISVKLNEFPTIHVSLGNVNISQHPKPTSHSLLEDRDDADQHPISAIAGLSDALDLKVEQSELDSAVDSALGEAKDRGDFDGKSAYEYAKDAGYAGSEADFAEKLAADCSSVHIGPSAPEKDADIWIDTDEEPEKEEINIPTPDFAASEDEDGHILNRTHFVDKDGVVHKLDNKFIDADWMATSEEHIATAEVIPEQKVSSIWSDLQYTLQPGIEYDVIINDVVYPCVAWGSGAVQLGNDTSLSKNDYPFCVYWAGGTATMGMFFYDENVFSSPIYLKVTEHSWTDYNKLPEGFLPDCVVKSVNGAMPDDKGNVIIESGKGQTEWKKLRAITVPADVSSDQSDVTWIVNDSGAVKGIEIDTDSSGNAFNCSEFVLLTVGGCSATDRVDIYGDGTFLCSVPNMMNINLRYGYFWIRKLGKVWCSEGTWAAANRFIHDKVSVDRSGFFGHDNIITGTDIISVSSLSIQGSNNTFNSGYKFEIWGR